MAEIDFSKLTNQNNTIDFDNLVDTSDTIDFSKIIDKPEEAPGFLDTLRFKTLEGAYDLWKYESLPAGVYQIATGNTKQEQAKEAVAWLKANPDKKETEEYQQYKKIERLFDYTLDETPFNVALMKEAFQSNPGMFAGEMANALVADPYLIIPLFWEGWIAKGVQATKAAQKIAKVAPRTVSGTARGVASVPAMSIYSSVQQLSEDGSIEPKRLATEVGLGGSAAFGMGALFAGTNSKLLKSIGGYNGKDLDAELRAAYQKRFGETGDRLAKSIMDDDITTDMNIIMDRLLKDIAERETGIKLKDADILEDLNIPEYLRNLRTKAAKEGFDVEWSEKFLYKHAKESGVIYNSRTDKFKLSKSELEAEWNNKFKSKFSDFDDFVEYKRNKARIKNDKRFKDATETAIDEEALIRSFRQKESFHKFNQAIKDEVTPWVRETYSNLVEKSNRRFYHINNIVENAETPLMAGALLGAGGYLAGGEDQDFWRMAGLGAGTITLGKSAGSIVTRLKSFKVGKKLATSSDETVRTRLDEIKKDLPEGKDLDDLSIKDSPEFYTNPKVKASDLIKLGRAEEVQQAKGLAVSRYLLDDYRNFTQVSAIDINRIATQIAVKLGTPEREIEVTKFLQGNKDVKLTPDEIKVAKDIRKIYDDVYETFQETETRFKFYEDYVTGFWKWNEFTDDVAFATQVRDLVTKSNPSRIKGFSVSQLEKEFPSYEAGIAAGLEPQTMRISEILRKYLNSSTRSIGQRRLVSMLEEAPLPGRGDGKGGIAKLMYMDKDFPSNPDMIKDYVKFYHPAFLEKSIDPTKLTKETKNAFAPYVLREAEPLLRMLFDAKDEGSVLKAVSNINFLMKRFSVGYSFFHAFTLLENMMFTGMSFKEAGKTAARAGLSNKWTDKKAPIVSWNRTTAKTILERSGHYDDLKVATRAGVEFSHPEDIGYNRFYNILGQAQQALDKSPIWGTYIAKQGIKYGIELPFKAIDNITWDRVFNAGKLYAFQTATLKLLQDPKYKNVPLNKIHNVAATYVNDAYGGLNWTKLYMDTSDPVLKYIKSKAYKPSGRRLLQIAMFAPDWTTANFRILSRAFPGLNKDPMSRKLYAAYAVRAALIIGTAGMALQQIFTGTNLLANQDPTRVDLGNGNQLVLSKQFFEPLHWAVHPFKTAVSKQGMLLKTSEQLFFNKRYLTSPYPSSISKRDASLLQKAFDSGSLIGMAFVPFSIRGLIEDAMDGGLDFQSAVSWISGSLGHPIYNIPRKPKMIGYQGVQKYLNIK